MASTSPAEILIKDSTAGNQLVVIADDTYTSTAAGTRTDQIDLAALGAGTARQSDGVDFGTRRADLHSVYAGVELVAAVSGTVIDYYIGLSPTTSVRPAGLTGSDSSYAGTAGDSLDDSLRQLNYIGSLIATSDTTGTQQNQRIGFFNASEQFGVIVVDNNTTVSFADNGANLYVRINPIITEVQT